MEMKRANFKLDVSIPWQQDTTASFYETTDIESTAKSNEWDSKLPKWIKGKHLGK